MATSEKRTLEIRAKLVDLLTKPLGGMEGALLRWARRAAGSMGNVLRSVFNLKTAIVGLGAAFVSLGTIKSAGESADALLKLAASTGDTVENLSELQAAFDLAGVKAEGFDDVLRALLTQARKAKTDTTDKLQQSFADLGISLQDLERLGPAQLFERMAKGLEKFGTAQEKAAALGKVLPKQFLELLPILGGGLAKFQQAIEEARGAGATVTEQQAQVSERLNDSLSKIQIAIGGVSRALIEQFGPDAIALFERLAKAITNNRDGIADVARAVGSGLVSAIDLATRGIIGLIGTIEKIPGVKLIDNAAIDAQIAELERQRTAIFRKLYDADPSRSLTRDDDRFLEATRSIDEAIRKLRDGSGLAGALTQAREQFIAEMRAASEQFRRDVGGAVVEQVGGSGPGLITGLNEALDRLVEKGQAASETVQSVFAAPNSQGLPLAADEAADGMERAAAAAENLEKKATKAAREVRVAFGGDFWTGFDEGADDAIASITDYGRLGQQAGNLIEGSFDGVADAIVQTTMAADGSSQAWKRLGLAALAELQRIIVKLLIIKTLQAALGYTGGVALEDGGVVQGNMGTPVQPRTFASGGVTNGPTLALFGEGSKREAFVPLPDNRSIPVTLNGAAGGPTFNISISAVDGRDVRRMLIEQRDTIMAVWAHDVANTTGTRHLIQKAAR